VFASAGNVMCGRARRLGLALCWRESCRRDDRISRGANFTRAAMSLFL
jgi:hypothetical protein